MKNRIISTILVLSQVLCFNICSTARAASEDVLGPKAIGPLSVAIIPFTEMATPNLLTRISDITAELSKQNGLRVLEQSNTSEILNYYMKYVDKETRFKETADLLHSARKAYLTAEYKKSLKLVQEVEAELKARISNNQSNEYEQDTLILKAKLLHVLGHSKQISSVYQRLAMIAPDLEFQKGLYSKWERKAFNKAKASIQNSGKINVQSDPKNVDILLNGKRVGTTYYDKARALEKIPEGKHCIELRSVHYKSFVTYVDVRSNQTASVNGVLERENHATGEEIVTVSPKQYNSLRNSSFGFLEVISDLLIILYPKRSFA